MTLSRGTVLIVDDEEDFAESLCASLCAKFPDVLFLKTLAFREAVHIAKQRHVDVVITDMHDVEDPLAGIDLIVLVKKQRPTTQVIVVTGYDSVANAVRCMRAGCFDYISKANLERLATALDQALDLSNSAVDRDALSERLILADWESVHSSTDTAKKGAALEGLCAGLFSSVRGWQAIERVRTITEEIDLVILNESSEEFWRRFGTFVLVECKNWRTSSSPGRIEFDGFYAKMLRRGAQDCRLGFFVSMNGVAKTFDAELVRLSKETSVIVVLDEYRLWQWICAGDRSKYLKACVAEQCLR